MRTIKHICIISLIALLPSSALAAGWSSGSQATNLGSIVNSRHNLTTDYSQPFWRNNSYWQPGMQAYVQGVNATTKGSWNAYGEVCVYCHTPHGSSSTLTAPLWNRSQKGNTQYWRYNDTTFTGQTASTQFGDFTFPSLAERTRRMNDNSMTCLSCHDGTIGMDATLNMPGSGGYSSIGEFVNGSNNIAAVNTFLDTWKNPNGLTSQHLGMLSCFGCHASGNVGGNQNFDGFMVAPYQSGSLDLRDDHPIAISLPDANKWDFKQPNGIKGNVNFYDKNLNGRPDSDEVRFYNYGDGKLSVECSSCHDPHGVPSAGPGTMLVPSFLRVTNSDSILCLNCHAK